MGDDEKKQLKRPRPTSTFEHQSNQARASSSRPNKKVNKPTLVELAAVKYAKGTMRRSTKNVQFKGLRKTLEEAQERIVDAAMKTAGEIYIFYLFKYLFIYLSIYSFIYLFFCLPIFPYFLLNYLSIYFFYQLLKCYYQVTLDSSSRKVMRKLIA